MSVWMSVAALAISGAVVVFVALAGEAAHDAAVARTAADAAALAGAAAGETSSRAAAEINGAQLVSYTVTGSITRVVVRVDRSEVEAAAERFIVSTP